VEAGAHLRGSRLPDGTLADVAGVIEDVIEHPVRLSAKGGPIGRIERVELSDSSIMSWWDMLQLVLFFKIPGNRLLARAAHYSRDSRDETAALTEPRREGAVPFARFSRILQVPLRLVLFQNSL
jgi:hypothetical protein